MNELWAKFLLWRNGYCTKHLVRKYYNGCTLCGEEEKARKKTTIEEAVALLKGV